MEINKVDFYKKVIKKIQAEPHLQRAVGFKDEDNHILNNNFLHISSTFEFDFQIVFRGNHICCELYIGNRTKSKVVVKSTFRDLLAYKIQIEAEIGELHWEEMPEYKHSRICSYIEYNPYVEDKLIDWCIRRLEYFKKTFDFYIEKI